jgi:peptidoglycan-associated lipoprotein
MIRHSRAALFGALSLAALLAWTPACKRPLSTDGVAATAPAPVPAAAQPSGASSAPSSDPFGSGGPIAERDITGSDLPAPAALPAAGEGTLETIYFDFNMSTLSETARAALDRNAAFLAANLSLRVRIEGHCDERGSTEYNLALGDRRAHSALEHLVGKGVSAARLETVSFGEEQPADPGHNEAAWARNRRAEFHVR